MSNKLFPLVKSHFTFNFDEIPEIVQEELIGMINHMGIKSECSSFLETILVLKVVGLSKTVVKTSENSSTITSNLGV
jgi:hypothetical protein